jgi:hypothetical protein
MAPFDPQTFSLAVHSSVALGMPGHGIPRLREAREGRRRGGGSKARGELAGGESLSEKALQLKRRMAREH